MSDKLPKGMADYTERQLIEVVVSMYTPHPKTAKEIARHVAEKLVARRRLLRQRRVRP
jgi:response regulator of citrate/malate metabolism